MAIIRLAVNPIGKPAFIMEQTIPRSGRYIRQPAGYRAFIPAPLPPESPVAMVGLQDLLSRADRALGRLDGSVLTLPNPDLFVFMYVRKEAVLSSQIEGTQSSLQDVLAAEARLFNRERPSDVREVLNYIEAMARCAGRPAGAGGAAYQPELDRAGGLHSERGEFRSAPARDGAGTALGPGAFSASTG